LQRRGQATQQAVVARVLVSPAAATDLERMIATHSLPSDTRPRVRRALEPLARFPLLGAPLEGRWAGYRFILGPWRWMLIVYAYDPEADIVAVATIQDGRTSNPPTAAE
jgi:plasmid stabilization system protein ParE